MQVVLFLNTKRTTKYIHRLVVEAFIGAIPKNKEVNHKNGIRSDNEIRNLEIVSPKENVAHSFKFLNRKTIRGEDRYNAKLSEKQFVEIKKIIKQGHYNIKEIADIYGVQRTTVSKIKNKNNWAWL
jgi:predicted XRE-type DNA-binding protein